VKNPFNNSDTFLKTVVAILIAITVFTSLQSYFGGYTETKAGPLTSYNNYLIFKSSATHLFDGKDLYIHHPEDHVDLYKYSPLFALLMAPFPFVPNWLGIIIWNLINLVALVIGLKLLPQLTKRQVTYILLICLFELLGSIMNEQSNALMSGLMVLGIAFLEKDKVLLATMFLVLSVYIKLFSLVIFMILLFYPSRIKSIAYSAMWFVLFAVLPVIVTGWEGLKLTYLSWWNMLGDDYSGSVGFSVLGLLTKWFNFQGSRTLVFFAGVAIMILPLLKINMYKYRHFRYSVFSALLIWIIIFNHKAESPTFIIAMTGIGLYFTTQKLTRANKSLLIFAIVFISLVYSDLMPPHFRNNFFHPYFIKAVPCIVIWLKLMYEIIFNRLNPVPALTAENSE
jgi:hypothetical protein